MTNRKPKMKDANFGILHNALKEDYTIRCHPEGSEIRSFRVLLCLSLRHISRLTRVAAATESRRRFVTPAKGHADRKRRFDPLDSGHLGFVLAAS